MQNPDTWQPPKTYEEFSDLVIQVLLERLQKEGKWLPDAIDEY